jgi:hypothetical protein
MVDCIVSFRTEENTGDDCRDDGCSLKDGWI